MVGDRLDVGQRHVRERLRRGDRNGARHVRDAVVRDAVDDVDRIVVRRRVRRLGATALVDRDVAEDGPLLHPGHHLAGEQLGRERAGDQDGADHDVGVHDRALDLERRGHDEVDAAVQDLLQVAHPVDRAVEDRHLRAEAERDHGGVVADDPAADDRRPFRARHRRRRRAGAHGRPSASRGSGRPPERRAGPRPRSSARAAAAGGRPSRRSRTPRPQSRSRRARASAARRRRCGGR